MTPSLTRPPIRRRARTLLLAVALPFALSATITACSDDPSNDDRAAAEALVEQGINQMQSGDLERAEETLARASRLDADQTLAHYNLGVMDQRANRADDASQHYTDALEIDPEHGPSLYNSAVLAEGSDLDEAIELYRDAIEAQPEFAPAYMRLGFALNHLGRTAEAEPMLAKGLELDPTMADVEAPRYE